MLKHSSFVCACTFALAFATAPLTAVGQVKSAATANAAAGTSGSPSTAGIEQQWEYIVVSYGKTLFGTPQKTLAYRTLGLAEGQEAPDLESSLDILGRFGWEVVTIVGSIGGDQQIVLKRKYNRNLVKSEYSAILKGKELYIRDLIDIMEREKRLRDEANASSDSRLIELDAADAKAARLAKDNTLISSYTKAVAEHQIAKYAMSKITASSGSVIVEMTFDVTNEFLINGNSYRKGAVKTFIEGQVNSFRYVDSALEKSDDINIKGRAVIKSGGKEFEVYSTQKRYSGILGRWM